MISQRTQDNPKVFEGLAYIAALNTLLKDHLEKSTILKGVSKTIQKSGFLRITDGISN